MKNPLAPFFYGIIACIVTAISSLLKASEIEWWVIVQQAYNLAISLTFVYFYLKKSKYAWHSLFLAVPIIPIYLFARTWSQPEVSVFDTTNIITFSILVFAVVMMAKEKDKYFDFVKLNKKS